jgi:hypothetical protein
LESRLGKKNKNLKHFLQRIPDFDPEINDIIPLPPREKNKK